MQRRIAQLPLHGGRAPAWLFSRMHRLAGSILEHCVEEAGARETLARLADPLWFQALGCVLGFDWHSSGLTTVTCGAIGEAYRRLGPALGIHAAGGKGGVSRKTPQQIAEVAERRGLAHGERLIYASRLSAKVDSAAVQDGYQIYTHHFFFDDAGEWCVVQQGMHDTNGYARRYHWLGSALEDFVREPHAGVASPPAQGELLNMVALEADASRARSAELARLDPAHFERILAEVARSSQRQPELFSTGSARSGAQPLVLPRHHEVTPLDIDARRLGRIMRTVQEHPPEDFERLLGAPGVGPKTVRSLALISELVYGAPASRRDVTRRWTPRDPATFSYAHGGKDGHPFPVDRPTYDRSIALLEGAVRRARLDPAGRDQALFRLSRWVGSSQGEP
jgi:hypothetical protein